MIIQSFSFVDVNSLPPCITYSEQEVPQFKNILLRKGNETEPYIHLKYLVQTKLYQFLYNYTMN